MSWYAAKSQTLIAYASQSGTAKSIALTMAKSSTMHCETRAFSQLTPQCLLGYEQLFIVASTYGDGQAPEKSLAFSNALASCQEQFNSLNYAVLALGDSAYPKFCAFGHKIANLLNDKGAIPIFPVEEIDRGNSAQVSTWWQKICAELNWQKNVVEHHWLDSIIVENKCLNTQQAHRPAHAITLKVEEANYQAGDLLEIITPRSVKEICERLVEMGLSANAMVQFNGEQCQLKSALTHVEWTTQTATTPQALIAQLPLLSPRVYSIASTPNSNHIRLLVRQLVKDDGNVGFTSSALCNAKNNESFKVKLREHNSFRLPNKNVPIIMIAAGTGIAPFMSFLAVRAEQTTARNWLIFGEQYSDHDNYFNLELDHFLINGVLNRLDCAFSRDEPWVGKTKSRYVDDIIHQQREILLYWLKHEGAHVYVCGNKSGMGESVKIALQQTLGDDYDVMQEASRFHFDLY